MSQSPPDSSSAPDISLNGFTDPKDARMFGVVMALAGEVYVLKAEVQRLTDALGQGGLVDNETLESAGQSEAMAAWLTAEQKNFTTAILQPWLEPDEVADVRHLMSEE
jgi:hypothetical protein